LGRCDQGKASQPKAGAEEQGKDSEFQANGWAGIRRYVQKAERTEISER